jgi:hypothetical protein
MSATQSSLLTGGMNDRGVYALGLALDWQHSVTWQPKDDQIPFHPLTCAAPIVISKQGVCSPSLRGIAKWEERKSHLRYRVTVRAPEKEGGNPH